MMPAPTAYRLPPTAKDGQQRRAISVARDRGEDGEDIVSGYDGNPTTAPATRPHAPGEAAATSLLYR